MTQKKDIVMRGSALYKGEKITGIILEEVYGRIAIYPDGETGPIDEVAWVFEKEEVIIE